MPCVHCSCRCPGASTDLLQIVAAALVPKLKVLLVRTVINDSLVNNYMYRPAYADYKVSLHAAAAGQTPAAFLPNKAQTFPPWMQGDRLPQSADSTWLTLEVWLRSLRRDQQLLLVLDNIDDLIKSYGGLGQAQVMDGVAAQCVCCNFSLTAWLPSNTYGCSFIEALLLLQITLCCFFDAGGTWAPCA